MNITFTKMEGCGNDYVYVDGAKNPIAYEAKPEIVRRLSDRHFGIGGDGVIFINPYSADTLVDDPDYNQDVDGAIDFEMEMWNADGTRGEMCGNGIRCVAKFVYDNGYTKGVGNALGTENLADEFNIVSYGKVKKIKGFVESGKLLTARVNMGPAILRANEIPATAGTGKPYADAQAQVVDDSIEVAGKEYHMTCVSMGNPHAVVFVEDTEKFPLEEIGPHFEHHYRFPKRTNTEFVQVIDRGHVRMRVWERGTGETLACGTGCCATAVACILNGKTQDQVEVEVRGGKILVEWDREANRVYMTGPATTVFDGVIEV